LKTDKAYDLFKERLSIRAVPLDDKTAQRLFDAFNQSSAVNIYAEMESIVLTIKECFEHVEKVDDAFITYVQSYYKSLNPSRIGKLMVKNKTHQSFETELFKKPTFITKYGFTECMKYHDELEQSYHDKYHELLYKGEVVETDNHIIKTIIDPLANQYKQKIINYQKDDEGG